MTKKLLLLPKQIQLLRLLPSNHMSLQLKPSYKPPSCKDCIFSVLENNTKNPNFNQLKCTKFLAKNKPIKYKYNHFNCQYEYVSECRNNETKCGKNGRHFIPINAYY